MNDDGMQVVFTFCTNVGIVEFVFKVMALVKVSEPIASEAVPDGRDALTLVMPEPLPVRTPLV